MDENADDGTDEKYLNPVSNATLARMMDEGASENDYNEVDDVEDEDEREDTKEDPDESVINKEEEIDEEKTTEMSYSTDEIKEIEEDPIEE